jgi:hypothetical protein
MTRRPQIMIAALLSLVVLPLASPALAAQPSRSTIVSQSASLDPATQEVAFQIEFNQRPDFFATDEFGRAKNSFQYFISIGQSGDGFQSIIRGEEIHFTGGLVVVRNAIPEDDGTAQSGGWGSVRGQVTFKLNGSRLQMSIPLSVLTDRTDGSTLEYVLESYEFGGLVTSTGGTIF